MSEVCVDVLQGALESAEPSTQSGVAERRDRVFFDESALIARPADWWSHARRGRWSFCRIFSTKAGGAWKKRFEQACRHQAFKEPGTLHIALVCFPWPFQQSFACKREIQECPYAYRVCLHAR